MSNNNEFAVGCSCGAVKGVALNITPSSGNRVVCCCSGCQAFVTYLERDDVLDQFGGTDLYQTSQSQIRIDQGNEQLKSVRMTPKGVLRWYAGCCNTPIGNTMSAGVPFVGVIGDFLKVDNRERDLGPVRAYVQLQHAKGEPDYPHGAQKFPLGITLRIARKMLAWKLTGKSRPSSFFDDDGKPVSKPTLADQSRSG